MHFLKLKSNVEKQAKRLLSSFLAFSMLVMPALGAVVGADGNTGNIVTNGDVTNINGGYVSGNNTFNHFTEFGVDAGHTVNQYFNTNNAVNMVNSQVNIQGIYNSFMNGAAGAGNVVFISPLGMIVGAGAQMNVGSLHTIVPTQAAYDNMTANFQNLIKNYTMPTSGASTDIPDTDSNWSAFNTDFTNLLNGNNISTSAGVEIAGTITASGLVKIDANSIEFANTGLIKTSNMGGVELLANTGGIQGSDSVNIDAAGNITLTSKGGNIGSTNALKYKSGGTLSASAENGSISIASSGANAQLGNITAKNGISISSDKGIMQTDSSVIKNTSSGVVSLANTSNDSVTLKNVSNSSGNIEVQSSGDVLLNGLLQVTAGDVQIQSQNGNVLFANNAQTSAAGDITVSSGKNIELGGSYAGKNLSFTAAQNIDGSASSMTADSLTLTATSGSIGSSSALALAGTISEISAEAASNINITKTGDLNLKTVSAGGNAALANTGSGNVKISDSVSGNTVNIVSTGAIQHTGSGRAVNASGDITLNSAGTISGADASSNFNVNSTNGKVNITSGGAVMLGTSGSDAVKLGNISVSGSDFDYSGNDVKIDGNITADNVNFTNINSFTQNANTTVTASTGNIVVDTAGNAVLNGLLQATSGNVKVNASNITSNSSNAITASTIELVATNSIGSESSALNFTATGSVNAQSGTGMNLNSASAVTFGDLLNTSSGNIKVSAGGNAQFAKVTNTNGNITISSTGSAALSDKVQGVDVTFNTGDIIASNANSLISGTNINLTSSGSVGSSSGAVAVESANGINAVANNGSIYLAGAGATKFNNVSAKNAVELSTKAGNLETTGAISGGTVKITSAADTVVNSTVKSTGATEIISAGELTINAASGTTAITSGSTVNLSGTNITQSGQGTAVSSSGKLTLNAGSGSIKNSSADSAFNVNAPNMEINAAQAVKLNSLAENSVLDSISTANADITAKNLTINSSAMGTALINASKVVLGADLTTQNGLTITAGTIDATNHAITNAAANEINITASNSANLGNVTNSGRNIVLNGDGAYTLNGTVAGADVSISAGSISAGASGLIDAATVSLASKGAIGSESASIKVTNSSGDVNVTSASAQNGGLYLSADKNATFNNVSSTAKTSLTTTSGTLSATGALSGSEVLLSAADKVNAQNSSISGKVSANGTNGVTLNASSGNLDIKDVNSSSGEVNITAAAGQVGFNSGSSISGTNVAVSAANDVVLAGTFNSGNGNISLNGANITGSADMTANSLVMNAVSGSIGSSSALNLSGTIGEITATAQNSVNISKSGDFNIKDINAGGNISLATTNSGNIGINGTVSTTSGTVNIDSAGKITQTGSGRAVNATGDITLKSAGEIANADSSLKFNVNSPGKVNIESGGNVNLGTLAGDSIKLGEITLNSSDFNYSGSNIVIEDNITANNVSFTDFTSFEQKTGTTVKANGASGNILLDGTGNAVLNGLLQATNGKVTVNAGNITSTAAKAIDAKSIELVSTGSIGSGSALNIAASDSITAQSAAGMQLNSLSSTTRFGELKNTTSGDITVSTAGNATFAAVTNTNGNISLGKNGSTGNYTLGGLVDGKNVAITTAGAVTSALAKAINAENITIAAGSVGSASQALNLAAGGSVDVTGTNGININSVDSNINVTNAVSSNGAVTITASGSDSNMTFENVSAKEDITLTNNTNGLITLGDLAVNSGKTATITTSAGANSGVVHSAGKTITNKGTLNINNSGDKGVNIAGSFNNSGTARITSSNGVAISGAVTTAANSQLSVENTNGNLNISSTSVDNSGKITLNNSGNGAINLTGSVENKKGAIFEAINNGTGGLNFANTAVINNNGSLHLANKAGSFNMDGTVNMAKGSENTFEDGTANDFTISSDLTNDGAVVSFLQTGTGNLVVEAGTSITNNNSGTINLTNSNGGSFELRQGAVLNNNSNSTLNITNSSASGNVKIDGQITAANGSTNNKVNITNSGVNVDVAANTNISNISDLRITNTEVSTGSLNINGTLTNNHNVTLENLNNGATGIEIGSNPLSTTGLLSMTNYGQSGLVVNGDQISSTGGIHLTSNNSITVNGTLVNNETTTNNGLQITNIVNDGTVNNSGILINGTVQTTAKADSQGNNVNKIVNHNTDAASAVNIAETAQIISDGGIDIVSDGGQGVILDGTVLNTGNLGGDINITATNTSIDLKHYDFDLNSQDYANTPVRVKNEQGDISVTAKSITNSTQKEGVSLIATGNISLNATGGSVGTMDSVVNNSKTDGFVNIDDTLSVNVLAGGKTSASATGDVNVRGYKMVNELTTKNMEYGSVNAGATAFLPAADGYIKADSVAAVDAYIYSGQSKADGGFIEIGKVTMNNDSGYFSLEADGDVVVKSSAANKPVDFDFVISKSGKVDLALNGDSSINTVTAPESVKIHSTGDNLGIEYLGKFVDDDGNVIARGEGIIPATLDLKVTGTESGTKNSTLGIMHAYVKDSVTMRADNIYAYEDAAEGSTGFHSANEKGELITFDIQGVNTPQYDKFSPIIDFGNPNYHPEPGDASVRNLKLTIGDVENPDALFGAQFDRVYTENAYINATSKVDADTGLPVAAEMDFKNITVNQKGRLQNNKYTIDINNVDKNYDYSADATLYTKLTGSFQTYMGENVTIDTTAPIVVYNPHRIFNLPQTENSFQRLTNKSNRIEEETTLYRFRDGRKNTRTAKDRKDIRWTISDKEHKVLGSSTSESGAIITDILDISKGGMLVATNNPLKKGELLNVNFMYKGIPFDVQGEVVRVEENNRAGVKFVDMDRFTSNIILYMAMMTENL